MRLAPGFHRLLECLPPGGVGVIGGKPGWLSRLPQDRLGGAAGVDSVSNVRPTGSMPAQAAMDQHFMPCLQAFMQVTARQPAFIHPRFRLIPDVQPQEFGWDRPLEWRRLPRPKVKYGGNAGLIGELRPGLGDMLPAAGIDVLVYPGHTHPRERVYIGVLTTATAAAILASRAAQNGAVGAKVGPTDRPQAPAALPNRPAGRTGSSHHPTEALATDGPSPPLAPSLQPGPASGPFS